jgi:hypothetical protein
MTAVVRLARQFLIDAYECLVPVLRPDHPRHGTDEGRCDEPADRAAKNSGRLVGATAVRGQRQG